MLQSQSFGAPMLRNLAFKIYPTAAQAQTLTDWLSQCCWIYNRALEHRKKAYKRRKENVTFVKQSKLLTIWRSRIGRIKSVPIVFGRDAIRRVNFGMECFFRRIKAGSKKPGFPRFRSHLRYNSLESLNTCNYIGTDTIFVPKIGHIKARGQFGQPGAQKLLRVLRRASGWFVQVMVEQPEPTPLPATGEDVGIDLGLESFLTTDTGEHIENPRHLRKSAKKMRRAQKRLSRCKKGSNRRKKAVRRVAHLYEKVSRQRLGFVHRISRELVNRFDRIAIEKLSIQGLAGGIFASQVRDACWGKFTIILAYKAASAGRVLVKVNPSGTSQECPGCGAVARKELSERIHQCKSCLFRCHRDEAAAMVIRQRAFRPARGGPVRPGDTPQGVPSARPMNRKGSALKR
jgi:putative transposase